MSDDLTSDLEVSILLTRAKRLLAELWAEIDARIEEGTWDWDGKLPDED